MGFVKFEQKDYVGVLTMNRPEALNALSTEVFHDLEALVDQIEADNSVHVVVLTGEGRAFVAGADITQMRHMTPVEGKVFGDLGHRVLAKIENSRKPYIAAINGFALGGGCELSMACDIRLASEKAKFGQPEVGLGIPPGAGGTQRLPRIVGKAKAMELVLTCRIIDAAEAKDIGLISYVYPPEELMDAAMTMATTIAKQPQVAVRICKQCIHQGMQTDIATATAFESLSFAYCCSTEDKYDSMTAFVEKRKMETFKNK